MRTQDAIHRFVIENSEVRGLLVHLDQTWAAARGRVDYPPVIEQVLGEAFAATVLMSATIKFAGKLTLQVRGPGPVHLLVVQVTEDGATRGLARWERVPDNGSLESLFGSNARMTISVEADAMGQPHQGIVELKGETFCDALENYFQTSEQLQTAFHLAVSETTAAGMLLQRLPSTQTAEIAETTETTETTENLESESAEQGSTTSVNIDADGWTRSLKLAETVTPEELLELDAETLLHRLFHQEVVRLFDAKTISFECACSRQRTSGVIQSLGAAEAQDILKEQGRLAITCEFCAEEYVYDAVDIELLFRETVETDHSETRH